MIIPPQKLVFLKEATARKLYRQGLIARQPVLDLFYEQPTQAPADLQLSWPFLNRAATLAPFAGDLNLFARLFLSPNKLRHTDPDFSISDLDPDQIDQVHIGNSSPANLEYLNAIRLDPSPGGSFPGGSSPGGLWPLPNPGNLPWPGPRPFPELEPGTWPGPGGPPIIQPLPGLIQPMRGLRATAFTRPVPRVVHICQVLNETVSRINPTDLFNHLGRLPEADANDHGRKSAQVVRLSDADLPLSFVSSKYGAGSTNLISSFSTAFSSPAVLELGAGDVLFINQSFKHKLSDDAPDIPVLFDLAVYYITCLLEERGVVVIFSAGNSRENINGYIREYNLPTSRPLPGLLIGGIDRSPRPTAITSNYGTCISCTAPPQVLSDRSLFGESSGATAHVAGLVAALQMAAYQQNKPYLEPDRIRRLLRRDRPVIVGGRRVYIAPSLPELKQRAGLRP